MERCERWWRLSWSLVSREQFDLEAAADCHAEVDVPGRHCQWQELRLSKVLSGP